ncbi:hypothetical protein [Glaciimonas sp. GG7]
MASHQNNGMNAKAGKLQAPEQVNDAAAVVSQDDTGKMKAL